MLSQMARFHSFLWLSKILFLYYIKSYIIFIHLSISEHLSRTPRGDCKYCCNEHRGAHTFLNYCFHFLWINVQQKTKLELPGFSLSFVRAFVWKSIWSGLSITTPAFFFFYFHFQKYPFPTLHSQSVYVF